MSESPAGKPPYPGPAGGWGALTSSLRHVHKEKDLLRSVKALLQVNQTDGFDCPGCAWPDPAHGGTFEFCENGVKAVAFEATGKRVGPEFFAQHSVSALLQQSDLFLEAQGRLTQPLRYNAQSDRYEPITWEGAFAVIGRSLRELADPNQAVFYTSGRTSNEAAFLYQLLGRILGTNNFPDCSNMCHESSGFAMTQAIGVGKGTVTLDDFDKADAIFVIGQNPGTNHPRMLAVLEHCVRKGTKVVSVNPLRERGLEEFIHPKHPLPMLTGRATSITSLYLQPLIGGDLAFLKGVCKCVLAAESQRPGQVLDHPFIAEHTDGFLAFAADVQACSWEQIQQQSGLTQAQIQQAADVYLTSQRVIVCWAMGLTQHRYAVPTIQMVVNLLLLRGNMGKEGAGACPVRGHSNVQGDRTVGITERPAADFLERLGQVFDFTPPTDHGLDVVAAIKAMAEGKVQVFIGLGGNFAAATPDTEYTQAALGNCALTVQVSTKLNRSHLVHGREALILPCLGRSEIDLQAGGPQQVTVEDSMSMVHASRGKNPPAAAQLLSEVAIVAGIAQEALPGSRVPWRDFVGDYRLIRDKIEQALPAFAQYNQRIAQPGGFYLGNSARARKWATASGKARFLVHAIADLSLPPGQLRMMTLRSHDQYNTTIYDLDDRYRGVYGTRRVVFMNRHDLAQRSLQDGQMVDLISHCQEDGKQRSARGFKAVAYDLPAGCCASYFPETNVLVGVDSFAQGSRTPLSKYIPVTVAPALATTGRTTGSASSQRREHDRAAADEPSAGAAAGGPNC